MSAVAVLATLAVRPDLANLAGLTGAATNRSSDRPEDWYETTADEQLRFDQCLMADAVRLGAPRMYGFAQDALNQTPEKLRELAALDGSFDGPLRQAHEKDKTDWKATWERLHARRNAWEKPLDGLRNPSGFTDASFHWVPGVHEGDDFYDQTGLGKWAGGLPDWNKKFDFYDPTPKADEKTLKAVTDLGAPLYGDKPYDPNLSAEERQRQYYEERAFEALFDTFHGKGGDDARLFLASGGFPRTAPEPGTPEYRVAVEDMKTRFASCAWRDPIDPNKALRQVEDTAAQEWQQEIASQAVPRNQILDANRDATTALAKGSEAMADLLGQSWIADHLTRWQDYWSPGGIGWIGDSFTAIQVEAARGKCLDVAGGRTDNGTPVQIYTCNDSAAQDWQIIGNGDGYSLWNLAAKKCLDVQNGNAANGTKIRIWTCNSSKAQQWDFDVRGVGELRNAATGKCLDLNKFDNGHDSWLWTCNGTNPQKFRIVPEGHNGEAQPKAHFEQAKKGIAAAQAQAKKQLDVIKAQLTVAKKAAAASDTAEQAAYRIADAGGAPRGRGLLVGQQKAQVTKGTVAALEALVKAGETAEAATRASAGDSATVAQRALAQAAQSKAEFRKAAAAAAEAQAKAAADAAKVHRDNAKKDKETAEAKLAEALKAEGDAKAAASEAHAKRLAAEAEEKKAEAEKKKAAAKQADAAQHRKNAEAEATKAKTAKDKAEAAEGTAVEKKNAAVKARDHAKAMRDDAWDAEQKADASRAKADAKAAYADSLDAGEAADAARAAANDADKHADDAEAAAGRARSEANAATKAAEDADAAATRAEAAAKRSRAHADAAQAAKLKSDAAVKTATSAAADAIAAAKHAASEAKTAVELADEAEKKARTAKSQADEAGKEAVKALAASAKAAGFAYVTAQAAVDAGKAAAQVAKPANDAIQLGSPYVDTDSAAGLVVLTGQASKTIAEQQKAVADAHAKNAEAEASAAKNLAEQAQGDAKAAYQHAANAAKHASDARGYAKEALGYAADAAKAASKATASLARTIEFNRQATADAEAADKAAGRAENHAKDARDSADQAALDAQAARTAASEAEQAAKDARAAADRADAAATEAEEAAKDAEKYAKEAQEAADRTEREQANEQVSTGAGTGVGGVFYVIDEKTTKIESAKQIGECPSNAPLVGCTAAYKVTGTVKTDFYLCTDKDALATAQGCPKGAWKWLDEKTIPFKDVEWSHFFSGSEIIKIGWQNLFGDTLGGILYEIILGDAIKCLHGSKTACAWTAAMFLPLSKPLAALTDAVRALDAAAKTGIGFQDAWKGLRALKVSDEVAMGLGIKALDDLVKGCTKGSRALTAGASRAGPSCPVGMVAYNSTELGTIAFKARIAGGYEFKYRRNVAVAKVPGWNDPKTGDYVWGYSQGGGYHSENHILDQLAGRGFKPTQIAALYSERQPCPVCGPLLDDVLKPGTPISWSVPWGSDGLMNSVSDEMLKQAIKVAGGHRAARSGRTDAAAAPAVPNPPAGLSDAQRRE
ncbi:ricin-type beta-trefoil lectin domain protein [Streptomyces sp. NPDC001920]